MCVNSVLGFDLGRLLCMPLVAFALAMLQVHDLGQQAVPQPCADAGGHRQQVRLHRITV
jgi:hypothetical protein